jgi:hypothetical protein
MRSRSSGLRTRARSTNPASSRVDGWDTIVSSKNSETAGLGVDTTGVPLAVTSKILRAHMLGDVVTELTLRKTL